MAIIAGARTWHQIRATVKAGFMPVMKVSWITSPLALAFAQKFLPEHTWVPFFNIIAFVIGTYINAHTKKKRLAVLRKKVWLPWNSPPSFTNSIRRKALRWWPSWGARWWTWRRTQWRTNPERQGRYLFQTRLLGFLGLGWGEPGNYENVGFC